MTKGVNIHVTPLHKTIMGCFDSGHLLGIPSPSLPFLDSVILGDPGATLLAPLCKRCVTLHAS